MIRVRTFQEVARKEVIATVEKSIVPLNVYDEHAKFGDGVS